MKVYTSMTYIIFLYINPKVSWSIYMRSVNFHEIKMLGYFLAKFKFWVIYYIISGYFFMFNPL